MSRVLVLDALGGTARIRYVVRERCPCLSPTRLAGSVPGADRNTPRCGPFPIAPPDPVARIANWSVSRMMIAKTDSSLRAMSSAAGLGAEPIDGYRALANRT